MQWSAQVAFTTGAPWLPYGDLARNVEDEGADSESLLSSVPATGLASPRI